MQLLQQPEILITLHAIYLTQVTNSFYRDLGHGVYIFYDNLCQAVLGCVFFRTFPKKFYCCWVFIEHLGVFYATTIGLLASVTTPVPYVSCIGQAACRAFDTGKYHGVWHCII